MWDTFRSRRPFCCHVLANHNGFQNESRKAETKMIKKCANGKNMLRANIGRRVSIIEINQWELVKAWKDETSHLLSVSWKNCFSAIFEGRKKRNFIAKRKKKEKTAFSDDDNLNRQQTKNVSTAKKKSFLSSVRNYLRNFFSPLGLFTL